MKNITSYNKKKCYKSTYAPYNIEHNCLLWDYDHNSDNTIYVSSLNFRILTNVFAPIGTFFGAIQLGKVLTTHNIIHNDFIGLIQCFGLTIAFPIIVADSKAILKLNDIVYQFFSTDMLLKDVQHINSVFDSILSLPGSIKNVVMGVGEASE